MFQKVELLFISSSLLTSKDPFAAEKLARAIGSRLFLLLCVWVYFGGSISLFCSFKTAYKNNEETIYSDLKRLGKKKKKEFSLRCLQIKKRHPDFQTRSCQEAENSWKDEYQQSSYNASDTEIPVLHR